MKRINIKEFRELGLLQEINRKILHPRGLALEVIIDNKNDEEIIKSLWDYREVEEGINFDINTSDKERINNFQQKKENVENMIITTREKKLGYVIEPIPEEPDMMKLMNNLFNTLADIDLKYVVEGKEYIVIQRTNPNDDFIKIRENKFLWWKSYELVVNGTIIPLADNEKPKLEKIYNKLMKRMEDNKSIKTYNKLKKLMNDIND